MLFANRRFSRSPLSPLGLRSLCLLWSLGAGALALAAQPAPSFIEAFRLSYGGATAAAWGDFDGDGDLDLALHGSNTYVTLFQNQRDGTFTKLIEFRDGSTGGYYGLHWGDADRDGDLDLAVGSFYPGQSYLYVNQGGGNFLQTPQFGSTAQTMDVEWGDYDKDGDLDAAVANNVRENALYVNNGDGTFTRTLQFGSRAKNVAWGDYDRDGDLDLALASSSDSVSFLPNYLYVNNGDGTFRPTQPFGTSRHSMSLDWGDCDGDGDLDLALGNHNPYGSSDPQNRLYKNNGDGTFTPSPQFGAYGLNLAWGDYDADGDLDLAVASQNGNRLYTNTGGCTFTESAQFGEFAWDIAWGDMDADGDLDLVARDVIYRNQLPHPPVANPDAKSTDEDAALSFPASDLAANDTDADGDPLSVTAVAATADTHGTVALAGGTVTYAPAPDFYGPAGFDYTVSDGKGGAATGKVQVEVKPVNDPPEVSDLTATPASGTAPLAVAFAGTATDRDGTLAAVDWDFDGDGAVDRTTAELAASADYPAGGTFDAAAVVRDDAGATVRASVRVAVADFRIVATPSAQSAMAGSSASWSIQVEPLGGFSAPVALSATLPPGASRLSATVAPGSLVPPGTAVLTVETRAATAPGAYPVTILGASGPLQRSAEVDLQVIDRRTAVEAFLEPVSATVRPSGQALPIGDRTIDLPPGTLSIDVEYVFGPGARPESLEVTFNDVQVLAPGSLAAGASGVVVRDLVPGERRNVLEGVIAGRDTRTRDRDRLVFVRPRGNKPR